MLLRFQVTNHASLQDEQELSLVVGDHHPERAEAELPDGSVRVVPVVAVYGTNASGKSNLLDALRWMRSAVLSSFRRWDPNGGVPRRPFALRREAASYPSSFAVDFVVGGVHHQFGFSVDDDQVTEEWLYYYPEGRQRRLYERGADGKVTFGRWLTGRRKLIAELLRPNSLYLSVAAAQGHDQLSEVFRWFGFGLRMATDHDFPQRLDQTVQLCLADEGEHTAASAMALLRFADLGVYGLEIKEWDEAAREDHKRITQALRDALGDKVRVQQEQARRVRVEHRTADGVFPLDLAYESSGTRTWIGLIGPVITTLETGGVLCVDELDARLHPYLVDALVGMFQSPEINRAGAQLVFSTHEAALLGRNVRTELFRDQVWFTEKDPHTLATRLFPMTEFSVRDSADNLEKRYLGGRYGAVPHLDDELLRDMSVAFRHGGGRESGKAAEADEGRTPGTA
ncbi:MULTISPECIES: ATP-binding protein [unclassified Streptomyces]|uniref:AAA family ATPase n=1 Tax=unclassified Streptomyces TaxID=2593676 RepID=UPI000F5C0FC5|nr:MULTISPECIES: ATP-binding protein [unclassified Streptomyces]WSG52477.1 ATP-binding protein [Streptomyces sp. NBC_01732]WSX03113.1 ATP-binding protein [Streptomyces sp. NBC_00987]MCX4394928.1 ATP-binding protein [Streptomyces sp. NBC_01767]MCX5102414.1 ATP-binding protein [Streptomyces sp. NBC_00439]MCX5162004.1 ATP-binding protein [Streptomyces sp. NBC_00305]